jgi:1-hydroxycarotenoid 3,4-desaturase
MPIPRIAVIGAGVGGLAAAIDLAGSGFEVLLFERAQAPGGKVRQVIIDGRPLDAGPTVFTLRRLFDELFDDAGDSFESRVRLTPAKLLARHAWSPEERLDLFADLEQSADAIGRFAGARDARGFLRFAAQARRIFGTLERTFIRAARPSPLDLVRRVGLRQTADLWNIQPFATLWQTLGRYFGDPRLKQLFARYATYCGSSPFAAPATLMLVAHVEQAGVWYIEGGMQQLAEQLAALAIRKGATLRLGSEVTRIHVRHGRVEAVQTREGDPIAVEAVVCAADTNALATGLFGSAVRRGARPTAPAARSLSAVTWNLVARTQGFELAHHSVFFGRDYRTEFDDIFRRGRLPSSPTVYVCAQDRHDTECSAPLCERLLCLINAPAIGDEHSFDPAEIDACKIRVFEALASFGLTVQAPAESTRSTTPSDFHQMFPATGGALYGPASHGWMASFKRAGSRTIVPGLYLAGGSSHPGPGVPMAAISGRLAAASIAEDYASISRSRAAVTPGGTSMR